MIEKPDLPDERIVACLTEQYPLRTAALEFLPLGYDSAAWVYRVTADDGRDYFLKLRRGQADELSLLLPRWLKDNGIDQLVPPLPTNSRSLWANLDLFTLVLYPFIDGQSGMEIGLSQSQWIEFGAVVKRLHSLWPPADLPLPRETFSPHAKWLGVVRQLQARIPVETFTDPLAQEAAAFWRERSDEIERIVDRTEELGRLLQARDLPLVICHADIHIANVLIDSAARLWIVDWDQPILAPKERDLMFVTGVSAGSVVAPGADGERWFFQGYGSAKADPLALAYYRYEWAVQEIGAWAASIFLPPNPGEATRRDAAQHLTYLFQPDDVIEAAYLADQSLSQES
jgi:spectinomycin phosphotransferase